MVAAPAERRSSANAGELSEDLAGRVDIKAYYSGGLRFKHIEPVPQSGFRDMGGTVDNGPVRGRMAVLAQSDASSSLGPHTGTATIWQAAVDGTVSAVHLAAVSADAGTHSIVFEAFAGGAWHQLGASLAIGTSAKARTIAAAPGAGAAGATSVRLRVTFSASATMTLGTVTVLAETATQDHPRYRNLRHDSGDRYFLSVTRGWLDVFLDDDFAAGVYLPEITTTILPEIGFYTENATVGLFHNAMKTRRVRRAGSASEWEVDDWPYDGIPKVDLGGDYEKHDDKWTLTIRWSNSTDQLSLLVSVGGESAVPVWLKDANGDPIAVEDAEDQPALWETLAGEIATALVDLPSLGAGVTVTYTDTRGNNLVQLDIAFGGDLSGQEYQVDAQITNTASIAVLATHTETGKTDYEPLLSATRGWPGAAALWQDRLDYFDIKAVPAANLLSQAGEYFNINIAASGDRAARLDKLRGSAAAGGGQAAERVLAVHDSVYTLLFTDLGVYFVPNRTISKDKPLDFTSTSENGIVAHTQPVEIEKRVYYVGHNDDSGESDGHQILSLAYDELQTSFESRPESLLASHLVKNVIRSKRQKSSSDIDAPKMWCLRRDGRVIVCQVIKSEEILGFFEWLTAADGLAREIEIDARNQLRLCVERGGRLRHERRDRDLYLQACVTSSCDLAGKVSGLDLHEGRTVWAVAQGYMLGPFTVSGGTIDLGDAYTGAVRVGLWTPPVYESMPFYRILPNDEMIVRPGRIHTAYIDVMETTSIAVGANGQPPRDVTLLRASDPADQPMPAKSETLTVSGLLGAKVGTTLVLTQVKPGRLRVRNYEVGKAL